jgi:hypothetical protein
MVEASEGSLSPELMGDVSVDWPSDVSEVWAVSAFDLNSENWVDAVLGAA